MGFPKSEGRSTRSFWVLHSAHSLDQEICLACMERRVGLPLCLWVLRKKKREKVKKSQEVKRQRKCAIMISLSFSYSSAVQICASFYLIFASFTALWEL